VYADQYPYRASATDLVSALVPRWAEEGGPKALVQRLQDEKTRARVRADIKANLARRGGAGRIQFRYSLSDPFITGKTLKQVAQERNEQPLDVVLELISHGRPGIISFNMHSEDVRRFMKQPWTMTGSDGGLVSLGSGVPHPRNYGAFPRKIEKYVFDEKVIELAFAIRSMTGLPARVFDMSERGMIHPGAKADLILFDPQKLDDNATFDAPHQYATGVIHVLVDGTFAIKNGRFQDSRKGTVLRHKHQD
jgi:N-acyl-D-aspartate/D-glutamate deacylase